MKSKRKPRKKMETACPQAVRDDVGASRPPPFPLAEYNAALEQEREARDTAFLGVTLDICGEPVQLLTTRMFIQLSYAGSPFLIGGPPSPEHVAQILWRLSPEYSTATSHSESALPERTKTKSKTRRGERKRKQKIPELSPRQAFVRRIASLPYKESCEAIEKFLDLMLFDAPPSSGKSRAPTVSFATNLIDFFARHYGWTRHEILDAPLPQLFQLMKEINRRTNPDAVSINRLSDKVKKQWGIALEDWAKQNSGNGKR